MRNKNGNTGVVIILIIFGILILAGIIIGVVVLNQKGFFKPNNDQDEIQTMKMFMLARSKENQEPTSANYEIYYKDQEGNHRIYTAGKVDPTLTEIKVPKVPIIEVRCWSDNHYLVRAYKQFAPIELQENKSTFACDMYKIGDIEVKQTGELQSDRDIIKLNLTTDYSHLKTSLCVGWTGGIKSVSIENQIKECSVGSWKNYSHYYAENKTYDWLPEKTYLCGEDEYEQCEFVEATKCKLIGEEIPHRFTGLVDSCFYTANSIHQGSQEIQIDVETYNFRNNLDEVTVYIYDKERVWDDLEDMYVWKSELNGKDIGAEDVEHIIKIRN